MHNRKYGSHQATSSEEWISILHLSTRWEFEDIRALAMKQVQEYPLEAISKILISKEYGITSSWTLSAYMELCQRSQPLSLDEATVLDLRTVVRVSQLREKLHCNRGRSSSRTGRLGVARPYSTQFSGSGFRLDARSPHPEASPVNRLTSRRQSPSKALRLSSTARLVAQAFGLSADND